MLDIYFQRYVQNPIDEHLGRLPIDYIQQIVDYRSGVQWKDIG